MPDIFISYSNHDDEFAKFLHQLLTEEGINVFRASVSIPPGEKWSSYLIDNLKSSQCVLFLASKAACESPYVQQELGAALATEKKIIPVVWDIDPLELPAWMNQFQAINLAKLNPEKLIFAHF